MKQLNSKDIKKKFDSFVSYTEHDAHKVMKNKEKIKGIVSVDVLNIFLSDVKLFFYMLKDVLSGKYKQIPVGTVAAIIGTLLYVLSPADLIPDFIPGVGYLDDAAMLSLCLKFAKFDIEMYKRTMRKRKWK